MEVAFARKVAKICNQEKEMRAKLGDRNAELLKRRLAELKASDALEDFRKLPAARCHELKGDRKGELAIDLVHPKRLIFIPDHEPIPTKPDGGLDWSAVTSVLITEIVDYH